jgi:hypothetical protein
MADGLLFDHRRRWTAQSFVKREVCIVLEREEVFGKSGKFEFNGGEKTRGD